MTAAKKNPNNFRADLFDMAMKVFGSRHDPNDTVKRNSRDMLHSFFEHGRNWRKWRDGTLPDKKGFK